MVRYLQHTAIALLFFMGTALFASDIDPGVSCSMYQPRASTASIEKGCLYDLSVCAVFQEEANFLKEWIEYYLLLGVEHFILFNDRSTDNYKEVLATYIQSGVVELFECPCPVYNDGPQWLQYQMRLVNLMVQLTNGISRWVALIDIDEFMVPRDTDSLVTFLQDYEDYGQVYVRWTCFGTSHVPKIPDNMLMIEALKYRGTFQSGVRWLGKCFVKPHLVRWPGVHSSGLIQGEKTYFISPGTDEEFPVIRCFHYMFRDEDFLINVKTPRRKRWQGANFDPDECNRRLNSYNDVEDQTMLRFVPELRQRVLGIQ